MHNEEMHEVCALNVSCLMSPVAVALDLEHARLHIFSTLGQLHEATYLLAWDGTTISACDCRCVQGICDRLDTGRSAVATELWRRSLSGRGIARILAGRRLAQRHCAAAGYSWQRRRQESVLRNLRRQQQSNKSLATHWLVSQPRVRMVRMRRS